MQLQQAIYNEYPDADHTLVRQFVHLVCTHVLPFVIYKDKARFVMTEISAALMRDRKDMPKRLAEHKWHGRSELIVSKELKEFKYIYYQQTGVTLTCPSQLLIADYLLVYQYLRYRKACFDFEFHFKESDIEREYLKLVSGHNQVVVGNKRLDIVTHSNQVVEIKKRIIQPYDLDQLLTYMQSVGTKQGVIVGVDIAKTALASLHFLRRCGYDIQFTQYQLGNNVKCRP